MSMINTFALYGDSFRKTDFETRPRVSYKIREHIAALCAKYVLAPKNVIVNGRFDCSITFRFRKPIEDFNHKITYNVRTRQGTKEVGISIYDVEVSNNISPREYAFLILEGMQVFLTGEYKKITPVLFDAVKEYIDWDYINELPFPAPFEEQKYLLDPDPEVQRAYVDAFGE
ncbi:hypothetical protein AAG747_28835 [Rapidithrix thailandica]|uniref:Uncharacterized protein n=1 Tax=Rapidithrix thailandica TaxID=413964 RepID=A0AAW9SH61_9BACT